MISVAFFCGKKAEIKCRGCGICKDETDQGYMAGRVNDGTGITISLVYYENETVIRDDLSGKRLHLEYDQYHRVVRVKDDNGRQTLLAYEGDDLCSVTNPEGYVTRYAYDANHYIMSEAITLSYEKADGGTLITTTYPGGLVKKIRLTESGRIEWMVDSNGARTSP